jgi:hypothetical protein
MLHLQMLPYDTKPCCQWWNNLSNTSQQAYITQRLIPLTTRTVSCRKSLMYSEFEDELLQLHSHREGPHTSFIKKIHRLSPLLAGSRELMFILTGHIKHTKHVLFRKLPFRSTQNSVNVKQDVRRSCPLWHHWITMKTEHVRFKSVCD